ncbi:TIR domain-containing protein [Sphingomonas edaphi]|uniref:TIR domain-containing protein n=1 Tax=Sphingomonas edaphi TaxID=2315689 RepID=A0A418PYS3_9SPHN|nr:TIR domain-containing protein [Sphingomonas edaphi]RIX27427.1 TIR domain-containing protein [Sphingomonas edaphi]
MSGGACDIFISYKAEDRSRLKVLVDALEAEDMSVWWDARIGGGAHWREEIEQHLDAARCVIVAWSKRSVGPEGHFVRDEASRAMRLGTYLPIRIDAVDPPLGFGEIQALALQGWKGKIDDPRFQNLLKAVRARVSGKDGSCLPPTSEGPNFRRRTLIAGAVGIGAVAATGSGWLLLRSDGKGPKRIAVLPFTNMSNDPEQAYFAEGITEELRSALSRIGLEVIGRTSSTTVAELDSRTAAARLKAAYLLTGSVRRSADLIRITAQLVDGRDGVQRWAQSYDRAAGDAIRVQTDIAASVARALSIEIGRSGQSALTLGGTADSLAQDMMFRARQARVTAGSRAEFDQALRLVDGAIARDPNYASAHVERAMVLITITENFPADPASRRLVAAAEASARQAARLAPGLGAPHVALARIAYNRLDLAGIIRETKTALALSPDDTDVLLEAATTMATFGRSEEALRLSDRLLALDGLAARSYARRSLVMLLARRYREAIDAVRQAEAIAPGNPARFATAGDAWLLLGQPERARTEYARMPADDYLRMTGEGMIAARAGDKRGAERAIARLTEAYGSAVAYQIAAINAQSGERDRAFARFDQALSLKDPGLVGLTTDPFLDPIRDDPRYAVLVQKLRFP